MSELTGICLFVWRTVVSLLGGFPALRDALRCRDERREHSGGWASTSLPQLATDSPLHLLACLRTCIFSFFVCLLCCCRLSFFALPGSLHEVWIEESWDNGEKQSSALATPWRSYLRRASRRSGRIWSRAPRTCWQSCSARRVRRQR